METENKQPPFFSIVMPTYNRASFLPDTIHSVLQQLFQDWELIIIDDGSTDNTSQTVQQFADARIRYYWQTNQERSAARNKGIELAAGKFICFLDSDDHWRKNHLTVLFDKIQENNGKPALYFTSIAWNFPDRKQDVIFNSPTGKNLAEYVITNQIATPSACIHFSLLESRKFNTSIRINEDVELFARIVSVVDLIQSKEVTVDVIIHNQNTQALTKNYITPQMNAMNIIFSNPDLKNKISASFKRERFRQLRHQLINYYLSIENFAEMNKEIVKFLFLYPFDKQNKSKIVLLLYHLPGGSFIQKTVHRLKRK